MDDTLADPGPVEEHRFPCPNCGSDMRFDPGRGHLVCDHCGNEGELPGVTRQALDASRRELDLHDALRGLTPASAVEETRVVPCPSCGARFEFDPAVHAAECPFCATPVVADTGTDRHIKPAAVLPFAKTEEEAKGYLKKWLVSRWFAPNGLKRYARAGRRMTGIYVPYWTFDARSFSRYTGQRGDHYYVSVRGSDGKTRRERRTRWTPVSGQVSLSFDDVLVLGSTSLPKSLTEALEPWDLSNLRPYDPSMLAGFRAEAYTVELDEARHDARAKMDRMIESAVRRDIGGDVQRIGSIDTRLSDETFKHILLPIWIAAYKYAGRSFRFVVNARSGEVQGERPYSKWKIAFAILAALLALAIAALVYDEVENDGAFRRSITGAEATRPYDAPRTPTTTFGDQGDGIDRPRIPIGGDIGGDFQSPD